MIDDPIQPQGPRIPRDAFETNLYREYIRTILKRWEGTPGLGEVHVSVSGTLPQRGRYTLTIARRTPDTAVWEDLMRNPTVRGTCWLEPAYEDDRPRVWWELPAQEGLPGGASQTNYAPEGPPVLDWDRQG